ncbi:ABC transporter ATP-binding protein [Gracilinema caldarium]|uniref:Daunorubicin resistance ABC transporter ATPase subunit n=1 Tax=Gracilinema caldarium (strain ATCC 51460 / DSM 7334 / H1) TaxID=744872 RepID=F8EY44_GRAC1|nr:ATP-binding cassette domain-containing protein [Gracilinema caldarium]AEJ20705.1 daunorubicin resistance ABC transporter ATPase subunit [Gracilinema caldarium DSM 7334]
MQPIIEVKNFTKRYGNFVAVNGISFTVEEGSIFAFLGPNGAGKSTTINTLCTIIEKTSGDLILNGHEVSKDRDKVRADIGIVFQTPTLDERLTVEENLRFHSMFYGVPKVEMRDRITSALNLVDLSDWARSPVGALSGGMKRRVEIARALVHLPKVLFLDEPTAGLDPQSRTAVWEYIIRLQKEHGITVFLTTHYMDEAEICSKVAIIDHGKIAAFGTPAELKAEFALPTIKILSERPDAIARFMRENGIAHELSTEGVTVHTTNNRIVIEALYRFKDAISGFEKTHGSLNDVFLAVAGKEIRN